MAMIDREGDERPRLKARCFKTEMTKCNGGASIKAAESPNGGDSALQKAKAKTADSQRARFCATKAKAFGNRGGLSKGESRRVSKRRRLCATKSEGKGRRFAKGAILRCKGEGVRQSRRTKARAKAAESPNGGDSALQKAKAKAADSRRTRFCAAMRILVPSGKADVFGFGLLVDGNVRVGVLPEGEEVLIRFASVGAGRISIRALRGLRFEGVGAAQA